MDPNTGSSSTGNQSSGNDQAHAQHPIPGLTSGGPSQNPLMTRVNQSSGDLAQFAAVGTQQAPPSVIGDFVGISGAQPHLHHRSRVETHDIGDTLRNIQLGGLDDETNELDEDPEEDDVTLDYSQLRQQEQQEQDGEAGSSGSLGAGVPISVDMMAVASAVDPKGLMAISGQDSWDPAGGLEEGQDENEDELDMDDPAMEELGFALQPRTKRDKRKERKTQRKSGNANIVYSPEVQKLLGMANNAYVRKEFNEAVELFQQVIVKDHRVFQAWNIMGVIQEELGNTEKALQLYLVGAHLTPKDGALWKKLAKISKDCGYNQQALYCFSKAYSADKTDLDALWDRSVMQSIMDQPEKAIRGFTTLLASRPHYMPALEEIVSLYSTQSQDNKKYQENMHRALELYEAAYLHYSSMPDRFAATSDDPFDVLVENQQEGEPFGYSALNMLSDLYIMFEEYEKPLQIIKTWSRRLQKRAHQTWWDDYKDDREFDTDAYDEELQASLGENRTRGLPIDLRIKIGTCRLMLEEVKEAKAQFKYLWKCSVEDFPDLYEGIAELYVSKMMWKDGYNVIRAMLQFDELDIPKVWIMAGECLRNMHRTKEARDFLEQAHRADPTNLNVNLLLAEVYEELGSLPQALTLVNYVRQVNAEKQAEVEKKRRENKLAREAKLGKDTSEFEERTPQAYLLDPNYANLGYRQIAPRVEPSAQKEIAQSAALEAMERIRRAGQNPALAAEYANEDRDRDIQLLRSLREHERVERARKAQQPNAQDDKEVADKFNRLEAIFLRINQIEKSRVWESMREAVAMTRQDRTQFIHAARELIDIFRNNKAFFKGRTQPYLGGEARAWKYRRDPTNADGLSEHVKDMSERLGRAMGVPDAPVQTTRELIDSHLPKPEPPTSYRGIPFDAWYLVVIRQAVFLTYEDRYSEAAELLMKMYNANVFYAVPRRRSGIFLVLLACAIWSGDYGGTITAGRWIAQFGGFRPLPNKIFQSIFTFGFRGDQKFLAWSQSTTSKVLKRQMEVMREVQGKRVALTARRRRMKVIKKKILKRGPKKAFHMMAPTLEASVKRFKQDVNVDLSTSAEYRMVLERFRDGDSLSSKVSTEKRPYRKKVAVEDPSISQDTSQDPEQDVELVADYVGGPSSTLENTPQGSAPVKKRRFIEDSVDESQEGEYVSGEEVVEEVESSGDDAFDDDDYEDDERYKTDYERDSGAANIDEDENDTDWEDVESFPGQRSGVFGVRRPGPRTTSTEDGRNEEPSPASSSNTQHGSVNINPDDIPGEQEADKNRKVRGTRPFTEPMYPKFPITLAIFNAHVFSMTRSHASAAELYLECLEHAPTQPVIHLLASLQYINAAMQRLTPNRQLLIVRGLTLLQTYYHLRRAGYGTIAHAQLESENKAKGKAPAPVPTIPPVSNKDSWMEQVNQASEEAFRAATAPNATPEERSKALPLCQQEAEYNFARAFHQMGQNNLALMHYRRVLELPSWRQVERSRKEGERAELREARDSRRAERAERRTLAMERRMHLVSERRKAAANRGTNGEDHEEDKDEEEDEEEEEEEEDTDSEDDEDGDDSPEKRRIRLEGALDDDPTDLKREAAFNMAKIFMMSGASAQAQMVMRKYCTF